MHRLFGLLSHRELLLQQAPPLALAMLTAELLYKFHSFTLECCAFLATWWVYDALLARLRRRANPN